MKRLLAFIVCLCPLLASATEYRLQFFDDSNGLSHWHTSRTVQDTSGIMWIATWNGLNRFDGTRFITFKTNAGDSISTPTDKIRRIDLTEDNNLICVVEDSIYLFNTRTCAFDTLSRAQKDTIQDRLRVKHNPDLLIPKEIYTRLGNLNLRNVRYDYIDKAQNHWLVDDHGLYVATPINARGQQINKEEIRYVARLANGEIWAALRYSNTVMVYDKALHWRRTVDLGAPVYCIRQTEDGHIWLGTKPGNLIELNGKQRSEYPIRNVYDIRQDQQGRLWMASFGFGLWLDKKQVPGTERLFMRRILINNDMLLAATTTGLLVVPHIYDEPLQPYLIQREAGNPHSLSSNAVMSMAIFDDQLFIGTEGGGLNRIRMADIQEHQWHFEHTTMTDGLPSDIVYEMMPWNNEQMLLQGNSALSLLNTKSGTILNFGSAYFNYPDDKRLIMGEVPPLRLSQDSILFAPIDGLLLINPADLTEDTLPVRIAISAIQKSNEHINYAVDTVSILTLAPHERSVGVWFSALDYRNCGNILYRTRLYRDAEKDKPWSAPSTVADIYVPDMLPGEYTLEISSTNAYQHWQNNTRSIRIIVLPTFLESTTGKGLVISFVLILVIGLTIILFIMREHKRKRQEALDAYLDIQERLAQMTNDQSTMTNGTYKVPEVMVAGYLSQNEQFVQTLTAFMEANMSNSEVTIEDLMDAVHMSRSSLNRKMHELFNLSPKDFLQEARIKHACSLLKQTDLPIKEIAYACGFSHQQYFATCFKNSLGKTPTEYRE